MSGTGLYTKEDVDKAYEDGYNTALADKAGYEVLLNEYKDNITTLVSSQAHATISMRSDISKRYGKESNYNFRQVIIRASHVEGCPINVSNDYSKNTL